METNLYGQLAGLEDTHWWYTGRRRILEQILTGLVGQEANQRIASVGCGTGAELVFLKKYGKVDGVDSAPEAVRYCRQRGFEIQHGSAEALPMASGIYDLVTGFDLLEHIQNDRAAVAEFTRILKPGGYCVVTVPAFPGLWSPSDEMLHHFRRYTKESLRELFAPSDFTIVRLTHFNFLLFIPATIARSLKALLAPVFGYKFDILETNRPLNKVLGKMFGSERRWLKERNFPFGISLLLIAKKKSE